MHWHCKCLTIAFCVLCLHVILVLRGILYIVWLQPGDRLIHPSDSLNGGYNIAGLWHDINVMNTEKIEAGCMKRTCEAVCMQRGWLSGVIVQGVLVQGVIVQEVICPVTVMRERFCDEGRTPSQSYLLQIRVDNGRKLAIDFRMRNGPNGGRVSSSEDLNY